jgi:hypothetical protein
MVKLKMFYLMMLCLPLFNIAADQNSSVIVLNGLDNPSYIIACKNFLLIEDNLALKMFGMKDFKPIVFFGKAGEGPAEFMGDFAWPQILPDSIFVGSLSKASIFDFSGKLLKEQKTKLSHPFIKKINDKYVSFSYEKGKDDFYFLFNIYDSNFVKTNTFYRGKWIIHKGGKRDFFEIFFFDVYDDKIIFAHRDGSAIEILNGKGQSLQKIKLDLPRIPFTDNDMNQMFKDMGNGEQSMGYVQNLRESGIKPDYYPSVRTCRVADGKIYVITYLKQNSKSECLVYDLKEGKKLKRLFIPLRNISINVAPIFTIMSGRLYQLVEDFDNEQWQLLIDRIE